MPYAQIISTGAYAPETLITNAELDQRFGEGTGAWLEAHIGIQERRIMSAEQTTSDLAVNAGRAALDNARLAPEKLDLIILATDTPDYLSPGTSTAVQHKLGAVNAATFDVNCACAGWVTALDIASKYLMTDPDYEHILVIGAYGMSKFVDPQDRSTATIFADGAGATLLQAGDQPGFLGAKLIADGQYHDHMGIYVGGTQHPATGNHQDQQRVEFVKRYPPDINERHWPQLIRDVLSKIQRPVSAIDKIYFTQINLRTIEHVMAELGLPMNKTHNIMHKWGYTGSACMPMALDDAIQQGKSPQPGELVVFMGSGGGFSMGAAAFEWV